MYEEEVTDSRAQQAAITLIIATLEQLSSLGEENHETLRSNCAMSSSRLLKKPDQCRSVATCAHVFWSGHFTNEDREVMEVSHNLCVFIYDVRTLRTQLTNLYCQVVLGNIMNCTTLHFITGQPTHTVLVDHSINTPTGQPTCSNA